MPLSEPRSCSGLIEAQFVSFLVHITYQPDFLFSFMSKAKESMRECKGWTVYFRKVRKSPVSKSRKTGVVFFTNTV